MCQLDAWRWSLPMSARAVEPPSQPYVVLVGISKYADKQIKPRPHAEDDAKALYDLFTNKDYLGVDAEHIRLLLGKPEPSATASRPPATTSSRPCTGSPTTPGADDLVIFAFIGEGAPAGRTGDACYFATDSTFKDRAKNAVAAADIDDALEEAQEPALLRLPRRQFQGLRQPARKRSPSRTWQQLLSGVPRRRRQRRPRPPAGRVVFLATNGLTPSLDLEDHGLFTKVLLDGLKGAADKEGYEPDGVVTVDELTEYLDKEMPELARKHGKTKEEKEQLHFVLGGASNHFVLTHNPAVAAKVKERLAKFDQAGQGRQALRRAGRGGQAAARPHAQAGGPARPAQGLPEAGRRQHRPLDDFEKDRAKHPRRHRS